MRALDPDGRPREAPAAGYVPALDGLRAWAVLAVIAFHAELPHSRGGFLGVEVFFVVSGYLITALLLQEQAASGHVLLPRFWLRRARRLLPALLTLLLVTLALALVFAPDSVGQTRADALAAALYVSNWWQVVHHRSYFMVVDRPPLLLHLWSLSVEEQFYLVWPLAVALIGRRAQRWVLPLALAGSAASALWMARLFDPSLDPTRVYVGSDTRLSGLLLGAALATLVPLAAPLGAPAGRARRRLSEALGWLGLGGLIALFLRLNGSDPFVYRGGLLLVDLASCALICGLVTPTLIARGAGLGPWAWLGRRSYGLYLWHWPIFAVTRPELDLPLDGFQLLSVRLVLTFAISELCFRFVETPIRSGALARLRTRPLALALSALAAALVAATLVGLSGMRLAVAGDAATTPPNAILRASPRAAAERAATPESALTAQTPVALGVPLDPAWPKTLTLLSDSVGLGLSRALPAALPDWKVEILGRPALMVKQVVPEFLNARSVGSVVVIALGYNSLFEKDRQNFPRWSGLWDRGAEKLVADLRACGAKKLVWITLREPSPELVDDTGRDQYERYAWFFPYVNERMRALAARHPELTLADWQAVSNVPGITKDLIHLSPAGVSLMTETVRRAVLGPTLPDRATP